MTHMTLSCVPVWRTAKLSIGVLYAILSMNILASARIFCGSINASEFLFGLACMIIHVQRRTECSGSVLGRIPEAVAFVCLNGRATVAIR
jgi:hypothetical protein